MFSAKHLMRLEGIDSKGMMYVYALDVILNIFYLYVIWMPPEYYLGEEWFFSFFYSFASGATCVISFILLWDNIRKKGRAKNPFLLFVYSVIQFIVITVDIVYAIIYGDFWYDGYLFLTIECILLASYMRRFFILRYFTNIEIDFS